MSTFLLGSRSRVISHVKRGVKRASSRHAPAPELSTISARFAEPLLPAAATDPAGPTIVFLNDCQDQDNFGAHALVDGLVRVMRTAVPNATIRPIPSHWLLDTSNGLRAFVGGGAGMTQLPAHYPGIADQFEVVADEWMAGRGGRGADELLNRITGSQMVFLNAEGSVYRTNLSAVRELFLAWLCKTRLGIPTVFANGTVHLTDVVPILPAMVRKTLPVLDAVAVREPLSHQNLRHYLPGVDVQLIPDSAFAVTSDDARISPLTRALSEQLAGTPYFCFDPGPMPIDHRPGRVSALYKLIVELKKIVPRAVFVRTDPADGYVAAIAEETGSDLIDGVIDYREWMTLVEGAAFVVTGRYHNPILAAIMGCPSITFASSSHKVHGGCEMLDQLIGTPYDGTDLLTDAPAIADRARDYVERRPELRGRLEQVCQERRGELARLGQIVRVVTTQSTAPAPRPAGTPA